MINQYPAWKYALIAAALLVGVVFALPNLFGEDPAVQVSAVRGAPIDETLRDRLVDSMKTAGIEALESEIDAEVTDRLLIRFASGEDQLRARDIIEHELDRQYVVALNLAPATPDWLAGIGALPMYLGLDLRGGVHFLMEVDLAGAVRQAEQRYAGDLRTLLREEKLRQRGDHGAGERRADRPVRRPGPPGPGLRSRAPAHARADRRIDRERRRPGARHPSSARTRSARSSASRSIRT